MKRFVLLLLMAALPWPTAAASPPPPTRWISYYGSDASLDLSAYQLIVLHPGRVMPVRQIKRADNTLLAYISGGESGPDQADYEILQERGLLLDQPAHWPGNRLIDIRKPAWSAYLLDEIIPYILAEGFDGIMLDTLDSPLDAEHREPERFAGMNEAAIALVRAIRARYPAMPIMVNRGFDILPRIAGEIDFLLAESILANYRPDASSLFADSIYGPLASTMTQIKNTYPHLQCLTLDYWPLDDAEGIKKIYAIQRAKGFIPYVGPFALRSIAIEPK